MAGSYRRRRWFGCADWRRHPAFAAGLASAAERADKASSRPPSSHGKKGSAMAGSSRVRCQSLFCRSTRSGRKPAFSTGAADRSSSPTGQPASRAARAPACKPSLDAACSRPARQCQSGLQGRGGIAVPGRRVRGRGFEPALVNHCPARTGLDLVLSALSQLKSPYPNAK